MQSQFNIQVLRSTTMIYDILNLSFSFFSSVDDLNWWLNRRQKSHLFLMCVVPGVLVLLSLVSTIYSLNSAKTSMNMVE